MPHSVSYTHLDVYKRQVLGVFVFAGAVANLVSGTVVKKLGTTRTAAVMFGGFALGIACLVAGAVTGQHALLPAGVVLCAAIGPSGILPGLLIPQLFGRRDYASISAVGMGMFYLGAACSFFILSLIHIFPVATGWQVAVPLIGMMALLMAYAPDYISMENDATRRRSFLLLGIVATTYAVASGMFDGLIGEAQRAAFNPMVLIEGGGALVIALVCLGMRRLEPAKAARLKGAGTLLLVLPTFALGCVTGTLNVPGDQSNFIWEASIWVLVLAVFVYGMRTSLFACLLYTSSPPTAPRAAPTAPTRSRT